MLYYQNVPVLPAAIYLPWKFGFSQGSSPGQRFYQNLVYRSTGPGQVSTHSACPQGNQTSISCEKSSTASKWYHFLYLHLDGKACITVCQITSAFCSKSLIAHSSNNISALFTDYLLLVRVILPGFVITDCGGLGLHSSLQSALVWEERCLPISSKVRWCEEVVHQALALTIHKKDGKQPLGTCGKNNWSWRYWIQQGMWLPDSAGSVGRCGMNSGLWRAVGAL